jgi:hypothetical protein
MLDGGMVDNPELVPTRGNLVSDTLLSVDLVIHLNIILWSFTVGGDR